MDLSSIISGPAKPYLEYGWVTAPNTSYQSIATNTITTLTIDTEIADTGNYGSIANNQITLAAGTYLFKGRLANNSANGYASGGTLSLYNVTLSSYVTREEFLNSGYYADARIEGQFTIASSSVFEMRIYHYENANRTLYVGGLYAASYSSTLSNGGADQRTTLKLWKLA